MLFVDRYSLFVVRHFDCAQCEFSLSVVCPTFNTKRLTLNTQH
jgi:hypothetical protein